MQGGREDWPDIEDTYDGSDMMTIQEYIHDVACGGLIDYDGEGYPFSAAGEDKNCIIKPSKNGTDIPSEATHIVWYNR